MRGNAAADRRVAHAGSMFDKGSPAGIASCPLQAKVTKRGTIPFSEGGRMMMKAPFLATTGLVLAGLALASVPIALADTVGSPCNDWMKIGTGLLQPGIVCSARKRGPVTQILLCLGSRGMTRTLAGDHYPLVGPTASPCSVPKYTLGAVHRRLYRLVHRRCVEHLLSVTRTSHFLIAVIASSTPSWAVRPGPGRVD